MGASSLLMREGVPLLATLAEKGIAPGYAARPTSYARCRSLKCKGRIP